MKNLAIALENISKRSKTKVNHPISRVVPVDFRRESHSSSEPTLPLAQTDEWGMNRQGRITQLLEDWGEDTGPPSEKCC
jgi:hypothetical protein